MMVMVEDQDMLEFIIGTEAPGIKLVTILMEKIVVIDQETQFQYLTMAIQLQLEQKTMMEEVIMQVTLEYSIGTEVLGIKLEMILTEIMILKN